MNLLDRHIFKSVLFTCAAAVGLFAFVLLLGNVIKDLLGYVLAGQLPFATFARLVFLLVPFVVAFALPMGMLTGVLLTVGRISADSEITAMRAAGLSSLSDCSTDRILGILGAVAGLYANFESMPWARVEYDKELTDAVRANPINILVPKTFIRQFTGYVIYAGDRKGDTVTDLWIWQLDKQSRVVRLFRGESGLVDFDVPSNQLSITLINCVAEDINEKNPENFTESPAIAHFDRSDPFLIPMDQIFARGPVRTETAVDDV